MRLDPLRGIHQQQRAFAGCQRPAHLIAEIDMPGSIDQVQGKRLTLMGIVDLDCVTFDRDAFFPFQVHIIQHLCLHIPRGDRVGHLQ